MLPISTELDRASPAPGRIEDRTPVSAENQANDHPTCESKKKKSRQEKQNAKKITEEAERSKAIAAAAPPLDVARKALADDPEPLNIKPTCDEGVARERDYVSDSEPSSILSTGSGLKDVVRLAARAYIDDRSESGDSISDGSDGEWDWLLDDHGRRVSPGRSGDTLADFIITWYLLEAPYRKM